MIGAGLSKGGQPCEKLYNLYTLKVDNLHHLNMLNHEIEPY